MDWQQNSKIYKKKCSSVLIYPKEQKKNSITLQRSQRKFKKANHFGMRIIMKKLKMKMRMLSMRIPKIKRRKD